MNKLIHWLGANPIITAAVGAAGYLAWNPKKKRRKKRRKGRRR